MGVANALHQSGRKEHAQLLGQRSSEGGLALRRTEAIRVLSEHRHGMT